MTQSLDSGVICVLAMLRYALSTLFCSFGALLGKVTPTQIMWLLVLQVPLYTLNASLAAAFGALDVGGSITIHAFGAYYGLAATLVSFIEPHADEFEHIAARSHLH